MDSYRFSLPLRRKEINPRRATGRDNMNRLTIPDVSIEAVLILIAAMVTLFAPWSEALLLAAPWGLGGLDLG
jgi:hypothetical protein